MTAQEKFVNLLRKLLLATRAKRITWSDTADQDTFRTTFNTGMVHIGAAPDPKSGDTSLKATLFNQNNTEVATVADYAGDTNEKANLLRELYELAQYSALRPDDVLASVETEVDQRMKGAPAG